MSPAKPCLTPDRSPEYDAENRNTKKFSGILRGGMSKQLDIIEKLKQGLSDKEAAKLFDTPVDRIREIRADLIERGILSRTTKRMSREERQARRKEIAEFVKAGNSSGEAAQKFKVSIGTVQSAVVEFFGVQREQKPTIEYAMKVAAGFMLGKQDSEIADEVGITREWVRYIRKKAEAAGFFRALKQAVTDGVVVYTTPNSTSRFNPKKK